MARKRDPRRDEAFVIWKQCKGDITNRALAERLDVSEKTLSGWKSKDKWNDELNGVLQTNKRSTPKKKESVSGSDKKKASYNDEVEKQKGRSGNPNPANQFSERNSAALIHGLRSKFMHAEQIEIIDALKDSSFADQIWMQIEIKFSAIIRMQKIMWVEDEHDHLHERSGYSEGLEGGGESYKVIYAHERYESYIKAQARAMAEYRNLIKQYIELTDEFDERRLKLEGMQVNINKSKAEIEKLSGNNDDGPIEIMISRKGGR